MYAATGARVRRLTMPDGSHWFPAVDVCKRLGHTNTQKALSDHVPGEHREILETLTGGYGLSVPAGREWRRDLNLISLQGLVLLVNACTKPACAPFKQWAAEVIATVQQEGSYSLQKAEVQPSTPGAPVVYATGIPVPAKADAGDAAATESVLADWRRRLSVTEDVWTLAVVIAPVLVEEGELRQPLESLAARTGLTVHRVNECLRLLRTHACIRSRGATEDGAPVYVLN
ncbi:Bro-N domain-containing protein [Streptomyces niveiscabiei]|nr:Bro-N domain-containing protein [Streptomyces niveiscabiei]MDX3382735.1 Bro-N domain-containing protein [Streptomyces niveiscabiei]